MSRRNARPLTIRPKGLSDAVDGTNAFKGAMTQLVNLVPSTATEGIFVPRSASAQVTDFTGFTSPGIPTALTVIGNRAYGMVPSAHFAGHDEPFIYDIANAAFVTITGVTSANTPTTQLTTGDWQPPHMEMIASKMITTHPGFDKGSGFYFGWLDMSGFSLGTLVGNTTSSSKVIHSISGDGFSTPILDGVQPGQTITGTGIPANTVVTAVSNGIVDISTTGTTHASTTVDSIPASAVSLMEVGMYVAGSGIVPGTYIAALPGGGVSITLSQAATLSASGVALTVIGGGTITISNNATATNTLTALAIAGGTFSAPVWSAGNTNVNQLLDIPAWVSQFNGRAWYAVGNAVVFSDSLLPLNITNASQALTLGDDTAVNCSSGMPLNNITTGGIVQSLMVFKGDEIIYQITGDAALGNLQVNALNVSVGTLAPNTICQTPLGLAFVAPDGLRVIDFSARVSDPLGANGKGVSVPFIGAKNPTRMAAAFNQNVLRITCQNSQNPSQATQEFWLDFNLKIWTGPHTFPAALIQAYQAASGASTGHGFILVGTGIAGKLWASGVNPLLTDTYIENGAQMTWAYQTVLQPDNEQMSQNRMGQAALAMALPGGLTIGVSCINEVGLVLNQVSISAVSFTPTVWGSFTWGAALWGSATGYFREYNIPWTAPIIFKQMSILIVGASQNAFAIGNLYLKYQPLGYLLDIQQSLVAPKPAQEYIVTEGGVAIVTEGSKKILTEA